MSTLLSVRQAAERLGVSAALVYALCEQRRMRHERHGLGRGCIRIPEDALEEYRKSVTVAVKRQEAAASPPPPPSSVKPGVSLKHLRLSSG